jgi:hypothetical protein
MQDNQVIVRRAGRHTSEDIHCALFPKGVKQQTVDVKAAIRAYIRKRHARG